MVAAAGILTACAAEAPRSTSTPEFDQAATVTTDKAAYDASDSIIVNYTGLPGNPTDWVELAPAGSPDTTTTVWVYTAGATSGSAMFNPIAAGSYVARTFSDDSYNLVAESTAFTVAATAAPTVTTDKSTYGNSDTITVSYTGLTLDNSDWISVAPAGSPDTTYTAYVYTSGAAAGSAQFGPLPVGNWEARAYLHNTYELAASVPFSVGLSGPQVTTDHATYGVAQTITVSYSGMPGNPTDWVALAAAGSPDTSYVAWYYTNGTATGSQVFNGLAAGSYEARTFSDDSFNLVASATFTVQGTVTPPPTATVSTDASSYAPETPITVIFDELPGNQYDWVALSPAGSPDTAYTVWIYTNGAVSGSTVFNGVAAGSYEARAYVNDSFTVDARSATITVGP